jgi:hypothetical protein
MKTLKQKRHKKVLHLTEPGKGSPLCGEKNLPYLTNSPGEVTCKRCRKILEA